MENHLDPHQNHLLDALLTTEYDRLFPNLKLVKMHLGQVLYEFGQNLDYLYFPITCIISKLYVMENGESAEIAILGNEGILGISLFMGGGVKQQQAAPLCNVQVLLIV